MPRQYHNKKRRKINFPKCPNFPSCGCPVQGFINPMEPNDCGRKPKRPPKRVWIHRHVGWS